jgi:NAD(P)-dependent dehydrogenase (short-subunit alcohol dehydrogenase family)
MSKLLQGKKVLVFGAGGSIGGAVARQFAAEGAEVFVSGRNKKSVEHTASLISTAHGIAHATELDACDDAAVNRYIADVVERCGTIDVAFNAVGPLSKEYGAGRLALDLPIEELIVALTTVVKSQFITARAAARQMVQQRSGVVFFLTGSPARGHVQGGTSIGAAFGAIETMMENMAFELGPTGVRSVCLRTTANTDSRTIKQLMVERARISNISIEEAISRTAGHNFLKVPASINDTARLAAFLASDQARLMTGTVVNSTAGAALD